MHIQTLAACAVIGHVTEHFDGSGFSCKQFTAFTQPPPAERKAVRVPMFVCNAAPCRISEGHNIGVLEARLAGDNTS